MGERYTGTGDGCPELKQRPDQIVSYEMKSMMVYR